jgi:hypothetical protein
MARVQVSSQAWGYVMDSRGRPRTDGLCAINTTVYEASTGETPISTVDFRTDAEGLLPGWVEQGTHTFTEPDGDTRQVEAARGDTAASGDVPAHNADFTDVHGITDTRRIAVREEAPVVATAPEFGTLLGDDSVGSHTANTTALSAAIDRAAAAVRCTSRVAFTATRTSPRRSTTSRSLATDRARPSSRPCVHMAAGRRRRSTWRATT